MSANHEILSAAQKGYDRVSPGATDAAVRAFLANLGDSRSPSPEELQSAMTAARSRLQEELFRADMLRLLGDGDAPDAHRLDAIAIEFRRFAPPLNAPPLPATTELPPLRMPVASMLGAILGALIGSPLGFYLLGMRDVGLLVGAPLGALVTTYALEQASRSTWLSRTLIATLGVATAAEVWAFLSVNPLAAIWRKLSGRNSLQRIAVYLMLIALLVFTRRRATYDRAILEQSVRRTIDDWWRGALLVLAALVARPASQAAGGSREEQAMAELGKRIMELHAASADNLRGVAEEVVDAARDAGFEGLAGPSGSRPSGAAAVVAWAESLRERYNVFGHVEMGDFVRVEQEPVVRGGEVLEKGLVRKQRG
jgi:hypothetical protein